MDFFKGGNLQFNNMNDFMNQINKKGNDIEDDMAELTSDNVIELCPEAVENKYHNIKFMEYVSLLTEEIKMMDTISKIYIKNQKIKMILMKFLI